MILKTMRVARRESIKRRSAGRMTPGDLVYQMVARSFGLILVGLGFFVLWPQVQWLAVLLAGWWLVEMWFFLVIVSQLLRGKHQVQFRDRAVCRECGKVTLPHRMQPHQIEPRECHGAWTVVPLSALTPPPVH
jgi:hypothetical protein